MEGPVDLDQAGELISHYALAWRKAGLTVGPVSWKDVGGAWPYPLEKDRDHVAEPDSVGVTVRKGCQEGRLVVFRGGWADLEYWSGRLCDEPVIDVPGWDDRLDLSGIERVLQRFAGLFG